MNAGAGPLDGCTVVMAHPDDEILWASAVVRRAARIVLCFGAVPGRPALSEGRQRLPARFPLGSAKFLMQAEAGCAARAAWPAPRETPEGLALPRLLPGERRRARAYAANFAELTRRLAPLLQAGGDVVTHNPWGEYGHEEHVQVLRAVMAARPGPGCRVWVTGYVSDRSLALMGRNLGRLGTPTPPLATDTALAQELKALYVETRTWTWFDDYVWPQTERFFPLLDPPGPADDGATLGMNVIRLGQPRHRRVAHLTRRLSAAIARRLPERTARKP